MTTARTHSTKVYHLPHDKVSKIYFIVLQVPQECYTDIGLKIPHTKIVQGGDTRP